MTRAETAALNEIAAEARSVSRHVKADARFVECMQPLLDAASLERARQVRI